MAKKKAYIKKGYESMLNSNDTSANIYVSMLLSEAWQSLSAKQKELYLVCKAQLYAQKASSKPEGYNKDEYFTMNQSKWCSLYKLYPKSSPKNFYRDMSELINKGFIKCVYNGAFSKTMNVYTYSDNWKLYNTEEFYIPECDKTLSSKNK